MSDVYIVGVDMIKFGRFPERTVPSLVNKSHISPASQTSEGDLRFIGVGLLVGNRRRWFFFTEIVRSTDTSRILV